MFEVRAYVGPYRKGGFVSYQEATAHAQEQANKEGQPFLVNEIVLRQLVRPTKKAAFTL